MRLGHRVIVWVCQHVSLCDCVGMPDSASLVYDLLVQESLTELRARIERKF